MNNPAVIEPAVIFPVVLIAPAPVICNAVPVIDPVVIDVFKSLPDIPYHIPRYIIVSALPVIRVIDNETDVVLFLHILELLSVP